jgi:hypothetical protein
MCNDMSIAMRQLGDVNLGSTIPGIKESPETYPQVEVGPVKDGQWIWCEAVTLTKGKEKVESTRPPKSRKTIAPHLDKEDIDEAQDKRALEWMIRPESRAMGAPGNRGKQLLGSAPPQQRE